MDRDPPPRTRAELHNFSEETNFKTKAKFIARSGNKRKREEEIEASRERVVQLLWGGRRADVRDCTADFLVMNEKVESEKVELEEDPKKLAYRKKQIEIGKNTPAYQCYVKAIPKHKRKVHKKGYPIDPVTPDINKKCSKRCFDGLLKSWRRQLHKWNPEQEELKPRVIPPQGAPALSQESLSEEEGEISKTEKKQKVQHKESASTPVPVPSIFDDWFEEGQDF